MCLDTNGAVGKAIGRVCVYAFVLVGAHVCLCVNGLNGCTELLPLGGLNKNRKLQNYISTQY